MNLWQQLAPEALSSFDACVYALQDVRTKCIYRIAQEGMPLLLPLLTKQVIHVRAETLLRQLDEGSIALPESLRLPMDVVSSFCTHCIRPSATCGRDGTEGCCQGISLSQSPTVKQTGCGRSAGLRHQWSLYNAEAHCCCVDVRRWSIRTGKGRFYASSKAGSLRSSEGGARR